MTNERFRDIIRTKNFKFPIIFFIIGFTLLVVGLSCLCFYFSTFNIWFILGGLLSANFLEYSIHRWVLHQKPKWSPSSYRIHSGIHHQFFTFDEMSLDKAQDIYQVVTAPINIIGIIFSGGVVSLFIALIFGSPLGLCWFGTMLIYYYFYEIIHFCSHTPENFWIWKIPFLNKSFHHHKEHHQIKLMRKYNFNVVFPIFDIIFKTNYNPTRKI